LKKFAIIGIGGYIASRHLKAIKDLNHELVVEMDITDSVGMIDQFFPETEFFTNFKEFSNFIKHYNEIGKKIDYLVICSPNYLHFSQIKFGLQNSIDVICEKPLVLVPNQLDILKKLEKKFCAKVFSILQLRLHPQILALHNKVKENTINTKYNVKLTYITSRGKWYAKSWKGSDIKSGGLATNIGVHFYDMLNYIFGNVLKNEVHYRDQSTACGFLEYEKANVSWFLSINSSFIKSQKNKNKSSIFRSIKIEDQEIDFSEGFEKLHTLSYEKILNGKGYGIENSREAIETTFGIRNSSLTEQPKKFHPYLKKLKRT